MKIAISGGHITPALACIDYIQTYHNQDKLWLIGRVYAQKKQRQLAHEKELALTRRVQFVAFDGVKWNVDFWWQYFLIVMLLFSSTVKGLIILLSIRPQILITFGGYLAVPLAIAAWILRIPILTHEQTRSAGKANIFIGKFAKKIAISHQSSAEYFPFQKTVLTGNLLRKTIFAQDPSQPAWVQKIPKEPLLYITGGSQGSQVINFVIKQCLPQLVKDFWIIHQCGKNTEAHSYQEELQSLVNQNKLAKSRYIVREWLTELELAWVLKRAKVAISRAGANTVDEMVAARLPCLFIPLPFSNDDEQFNNAQAIVDCGGALILDQKNLSQKTLHNSIKILSSRADTMRAKLSKIKIRHDAPKIFYQIIKSMVK